MADFKIRQVRRSFTRQELQHIVDLRFGIPHNYDLPQMSFGAVGKITGLRPGVVGKIVQRFLHDGFNLVQHRSRVRVCLLNQQEQDFLLDLQALRNFSIQKRADLLNAKFGHKLSRSYISKFYKANLVKYGRPNRVYDRAIRNAAQLSI